MDFKVILAEAHAAATAAILAKFETGDTEAGMNCGHAWVTIDGTEQLARFCRNEVKAAGGEQRASRDFGSKGYPKGWQWWKPGAWPTEKFHCYGQDMDFHRAGCEGFQKKLAEYGIVATVGTRLD